MPSITVLGSINMDLVIRCKQLPSRGETLLADGSDEVCGGKGANQAVAASRAGGLVSMIGRVGDDAFASRLYANLVGESIDCRFVAKTESCASGLAMVAVDSHGDNSILVVPNANARVSVKDVETATKLFASSDLLLTQLEVPVPAVLAAIKSAKHVGIRTILNPAPIPSDWTDELLQVDLCCPNQSEAATLTGIEIHNIDDAFRAARELQRRGAKHVVVTLGGDGVAYFDGLDELHVPACGVEVVDTTAAGDAFVGALAVRWVETNDLRASLGFACAAGALAASKAGAQPSLPTRIEIEAILQRHC